MYAAKHIMALYAANLAILYSKEKTVWILGN